MSGTGRGGLGCSGCFFLVCLLVGGSLALLPSLSRLRHQLVSVSPVPPSPPPPPTTLRPRARRSRVPRSLNQFHRDSRADDEELTWGFVDYERRIQHVTCRIDRAGHLEELRQFGYVDEEVRAELTRRMLPLAQAALEARGYGAAVSMHADGATLRWRVEPLPDMAETMAAIKSLVDEVWASNELRLRTEIYAERGFLFDAHRIVRIDYAGVAERSSPLLRDCYSALAQAGSGYDLGQYLGLFVAFLQEIPYQLPPERIDGRRTGGFWVPSEVLVGDHGDCDSKSAVFCALWRQLGTPVLFVETPTHVLVGVAVPPRAGQQFVRLGSRTFVLCEVAGPGKLPPGARTRLSGHFHYTLVEPTRAGFAVTRGSS